MFFHSTKMSKNDVYETPDDAWDNILKHVPPGTKIWEPFVGSGRSGDAIRKRGFEVVHEKRDFFEWSPDTFDAIVSNPPFSRKYEVIERCVKLGKPFALLLPSPCIHALAFRKAVEGCRVQIVLPRRRIHYFLDGVQLKKTNFDSIFVCVGMNLPSDIHFEDVVTQKA